MALGRFEVNRGGGEPVRGDPQLEPETAACRGQAGYAAVRRRTIDLPKKLVHHLL
jgi:hypothetical protein